MNVDAGETTTGQVATGELTTRHPTIGHWFASNYAILLRLARRRISTARDDGFDVTALVHEAFLRVATSGAYAFASRGAFLRYAGTAMTHALIDRGRAESRARRGQEQLRASVPSEKVLAAERAIELEHALRRLACASARSAAVVRLHLYDGESLPAIAARLRLSVRTVDRSWRFARMFLRGADFR